jgi:hypothetical protein
MGSDPGTQGGRATTRGMRFAETCSSPPSSPTQPGVWVLGYERAPSRAPGHGKEGPFPGG